MSQLRCSRIWRYGLARLAFRLLYGYIPFVAASIVLLFLPIAVEFGYGFEKVIGRSATLIGDRPIAAILMNTGSGRGFIPGIGVIGEFYSFSGMIRVLRER